MSERPSILAFAPHDWDDRWLSRQQLLSRLARRGWPVLFSSGAIHLWQRHSSAWGLSPWMGQVEKRDGVLVDRPGRFPPRRDTLRIWDKWVVQMHAKRLLKALNARPDNLILFLFHPLFWPYVEAIQPRHVAFHVYDHFAGMDHWTSRLEGMLRSTVVRADLLTTASAGMAEALPVWGSRRARVLQNGADSALFIDNGSCDCPPDLAPIPHPRIGYVGTINSKLDLEMVEQVARARPQWNWVFIGPVMVHGNQARDRDAREVWQRLAGLPNLHLLPQKARHEIPAYVHHMDVNTICYRISRDDWVIHGYPVKLHEYLASGRPVVAAAQTAVRQFSHVAAIAESPGEWLAALEQAISQQGVGTPETRRAVALENTWDQRVDQLEAWLEQLVAGTLSQD